MEAIVYISGVIKHVGKSVAFMQCSVILEKNVHLQKMQCNPSIIFYLFLATSKQMSLGPCNQNIDVKNINIVYVIESAAYGVLFTSCLCQKPERARYERVRAFDTNNEWLKPRTKHFLCRELFISQNKRIFTELQIRNKNSLTIEPNANLI